MTEDVKERVERTTNERRELHDTVAHRLSETDSGSLVRRAVAPPARAGPSVTYLNHPIIRTARAAAQAQLLVLAGRGLGGCSIRRRRRRRRRRRPGLQLHASAYRYTSTR